MFNKKFKVIEIRESGATITHYLCNKRKNVNEDIELFKRESKSYELMGKEGMIVWV